MKTSPTIQRGHPQGESLPSSSPLATPPIPVETYGGRISVEWDPAAAVTPLGQLPFFIEFLKTAELFEPWVQECPLTYQSPNAPQKVDLLGTVLLSILSGHHRYAHITTIRNDGVNPALLGMRKVCSEDSVRRALSTLDKAARYCHINSDLPHMDAMKTKPISYQRHRFPSEIISHAVWLYHRFCLSFREVEELLAERGIMVTYESIRRWCLKFGPAYARRLKKRQGQLGDVWYLDEVVITIHDEHQYLWRAVDQDGDTIDILVQKRRNKKAAVRFFRRLLKGQGREPRWLFTDKLRSYKAAHREVMPDVEHINTVYANNRVEVSHQPTRQQ